MRCLAFCDPGLDRVSVAIFRHDIGPRQLWDLAPLQEKLRALSHVRAVKTSSKLDLPTRLLEIAQGIHVILKSEKVDRFYMETPRFAGTYSGREGRSGEAGAVAKNARSMMFSHHASGAIIASAMTVLPGRVAMVQAFRGGKGMSKNDRLERVRQLLISIGRRDEIRNADDLDAVALGIGTEWPR